MITTGTLFEVYININILLLVVIGAWAAARVAMRLLGMRYAYSLQLRLLKTLLLVCFVAPMLVALSDHFVRGDSSASAFSMSLSDLAVSQYLQGGVAMKAAELDSVLGLRSRLTEEFLGQQSSVALFVLMVLIIGVFAGASRLVGSMVELRTILGNCFAWRQFGNLHLLLSDTVSTPFSTRSLLRRYIIVPTSMLGAGNDVKIALQHELQHLRQRDAEWEIALEFLRPIFFWNPAFHLLKRQVEHLRELSCDQQVLSRNQVNVRDYAECLLRTCENGLRKESFFAAAMPRVAFVQLDRSPIANNSVSFLRHRVISMFEGESHKNHARAMLAFVVPLLGLVGIVSVMLQKPNDWSHERIMFSTVLNLERLAERNNGPVPSSNLLALR